ncbi:putative mitochondrial protein [Cucumis melo var. makuwa]|uniref:Mitochondrial protein n=1 Tax=Cucumis melo var. makuwa TaxID=1194695 RepID=A0A5A7TZH7_CUCMM|nr:putative mitochondrial protein [Cucumis melo var. makuwa]
MDQMKIEFEMSMVGELSFFLGFQILQCDTGIFISQEKYARNLVKKFGLEKTKLNRTSAATQFKVSKDNSGEKIDESLYCSITGNLLYLTASRSNIASSVGVCARYQADPKMFHLKCVKIILKYIAGTLDFSLWYSFDTIFVLVGYCNAD